MIKLSIIGTICTIAAIALFVFSACGLFGSTLIGNGNVTTENRTIGDFTALKLNGVFTTIISQDGGPASVRVETDQNLQQTIEVSSDGKTLEIATKSGIHFNRPSKMIVYVNVKDIKSLINTSVGKVETQGAIKSDALDLDNNAVGKMTLHIEVQKLTAKLNSVGVTTLTGSAAVADLDNNSVGKLDAYALRSDTLTIKNNAVGAVEVYADKEISIDNDAVGSLHYKGNAVVTSLKDNGVGKVSKAD